MNNERILKEISMWAEEYVHEQNLRYHLWQEMRNSTDAGLDAVREYGKCIEDVFAKRQEDKMMRLLRLISMIKLDEPTEPT